MAEPLTQDFTLEELVFSQTAARLGITNRPNATQIAALKALCENLLQPLRDALSVPISVSSGFRSARLNQAVRGAASSQHLQGQAADIRVFSQTSKALFKRVIGLDLPFDQLIHEGGKQSQWVHLSFDQAHRRSQIFSATFPEAGGVHYERLTRAQALAL
jgi:hypothetical protein